MRIIALPGLPEVRSGDDLPALIARSLAAAGEMLAPGDVLVVTSKIVSKATGLVAGVEVERREVVAAETVRVVTERMGVGGPTRIVEGRSGVVMAGAGVDASNTGPSGAILTLPPDPDAAAAALHAGMARLAGHGDFGVVISDTAGRPWRAGQIDFALGAHGLRVLVDYRGLPDADGRRLDLTAVAVADEIAAAADLVKGKVTATPVALVRGLGSLVDAPTQTGAAVAAASGAIDGAPASGKPAGTAAVGPTTGNGEALDTPGAGAQATVRGARRLVRTGPNDFFRLGHVEAVRDALGVPPGSAASMAVGLRATAAEPLAIRVERAIRLAAAGLPQHSLGWRFREPALPPVGAPSDPGPPRAIPVAPSDTGRPFKPATTAQTGDHDPAGAGEAALIEVGLNHADDFTLGRLAARLEVAMHAEDLVGSVARGPGNRLTIRATGRWT